MSNIIPPLLSSSPPPIGNIEDDDDEFGDFTNGVEHTYGCDATLSVPTTPTKIPLDDNSLYINETLDNNEMPNMTVPMSEELENVIPSVMPPMTEVPELSKADNLKMEPVNLVVIENVPSTVTLDVYYEEPPELPDVIEDKCNDFGDFECNTIPVLEDEIDEDVDDIFVIEAEDQLVESLPSLTEFGNSRTDNINKELTVENGKFANFSNSCDNTESAFGHLDSEIDVGNFSSLEVTSNNTENSNCIDFDNHKNDCNVVSTDIKSENLKEDIDFGSFSIDSKPECINIETIANEESFSDFPSTDFKSKQFNNLREDVCSDDDFGDFASTELQNHKNIDETVANDDFCNFASTDFKSENVKGPPETDEDHFGDFASTDNLGDNENNFGKFNTENLWETVQQSTQNEDDDEFGDFDDFTTASTAAVILMNSDDVYTKSKSILELMFQPLDIVTDDFNCCDFKLNSIFNEIKDVTDTNALTYQWAKSSTQKGLLKALKIDTRNILYGHCRNSSMPNFAANLGSSPLEPIKSETTLQPIPSPTILPVVANSDTNIPSAQFDWNESGLANPLDSVKNNEDKSETVLKPIASGTVKKQFDTESVNSLQFCEVPIENEDNKSIDDFDVFSSFQLNSSNAEPKLDIDKRIESNDYQSWPKNMVPLRETYITNTDSRKIESEEPGWLKPTILTPVLPRKDNEINDFHDFVSNQITKPKEDMGIDDFVSNHITKPKEDSEMDDFDDFASYQVSDVPGVKSLQVIDSIVEYNKVFNNETAISNDNIVDDFSSFQNFEKPSISSNVQSNQLGKIVECPIEQRTEKDNLSLQKCNNLRATDHNTFQNNVSTVPVIQPSILQPTPTYKTQLTEINWPDPGISNDEMARFEMYSKSARNEQQPVVKKQDTVRKLSGTAGSMLVEKSIVVPANKVVLPSREVLLPPNDKVVISKDLVLPILDSSPRKYMPHKPVVKKIEEDDWSDFVSGQTERTATPELSLSIPQLSNIQPPKLPIPVITPQGLMQTKIPSHSITQKHAPLLSNLSYNGSNYQPSIISNQFAMQLNQNSLNTPYQTTSIPANAPHQNGFKDDSDEWSDFVSAPNNNAFGWSKPPQVSNTVLTAPNIITNPAHYQNGAMQSKKSNIPSISAMPDLDFIAPKSRSLRNKK